MVKVIRGYATGTRQTVIGPDLISVIASEQVLSVSVGTSPGEDHPFASEGVSGSGATHSGKLGLVTDFGGCPSGAYVVLLPNMSNILDVPANMSTLLARTNPSKPSVLLPVFAFELKDLPDMLRQAGRIAKRIYFERGSWANLIRPGSVVRDTASANLAIQFGWRPLVSDLWKIAMMQDSVERRRKELKSLASGRGLVKSTSFGSLQTSETKPIVVNSDWGAYVTTLAHLTHSVEVWGVCRWKPTEGVLPPQTDGEIRRQLRGLTPDAILLNVWEAIPWSWLADYFAPIGDIIAGANRTIATPVSTCIMRRRKTTAYTEPVIKVLADNVDNPYNLNAGTFEWHQHNRAVGAEITDTASFPTLGAGQLSILGSLAVMRAR